MAWIYSITHLPSGRTYIGKTNDWKRRFRDHRETLNRGVHLNRYLQRTWDRDGRTSFEFSLVEECPENCLTEREQFWIKEYQENTFNLTSGGEGILGYHHTQEAKDKISVANKGIKREPWVGKKISEGKTGKTRKPFTEEHKKKIREGVLKSFQDPEIRERHLEKLRQNASNPEIGRKISKATRGKKRPRKSGYPIILVGSPEQQKDQDTPSSSRQE